MGTQLTRQPRQSSVLKLKDGLKHIHHGGNENAALGQGRTSRRRPIRADVLGQELLSGPRKFGKDREETKGQFCKRAVLASFSSFRSFVPSFCFLYPRSGFFFGPGTPVSVPSFRVLGPGNICQNHPFGNHPFAKARRESLSVRTSMTPRRGRP